MKKLVAIARSLWQREPVLVGTALPVLVTLGVVSQDQASAITNAITGAATVVAEIAVAVGVRSKVTPSKPAA